MGTSASNLLPASTSTTTGTTTILPTALVTSTSVLTNSSSSALPSGLSTTSAANQVNACDGFGLPYCDDVSAKARMVFAVSVLRLVSKSFSLVVISSLLRSRCACVYSLIAKLSDRQLPCSKLVKRWK